MRTFWYGLTVGFCLLLAAGAGAPVSAEEAGVRWGVGAFADYNMPSFGLGDWYSNTAKFGMNFAYVPSRDVTVELEFHRSSFDDGSLMDRTFVWTDGQAYTSPNAKSAMNMNSIVLNGLVRLGQYGEAFSASSFAPYVAVGGGFYRYKHSVSGMLWPGQTNSLTMEMEPYTDVRYALGFNAGFGVEAFVIHNVSVDLRARYNFVIGQLRSMEDWGLSETFPLQLFDIGAGLKFYFGSR